MAATLEPVPSRDLQMEMYYAPGDVPGGLEFMERHTCALRWLVGMFTHWSWTPPQVASAWRFFALTRSSTLEALVCHQSWNGWWGMVCAGPEAALSAYASMARIGPLRHLEGERGHLQAILSIDPQLTRRLVQVERSVVLRYPTRDSKCIAPRGFRLARRQDVRSFQDYHEATPGHGRPPAVQELYRQVDRGAAYVLEVEGEVAALGKAVPAGSYHYIRDVFTFPQFRRQGCARRLMEGLVTVAADAGRDACLCVAEDNKAGLQLYPHLGFRPWGDRMHLVFRTGATPR